MEKAPESESNRILTLPNAVSAFRLLLVPLFVWLVVSAEHVASAGWLLLFIGGTDWVDGALARRLGQVSKLGKILDPLADRIAVATAVILGWITGILPAVLAAALVVRESVVAIGALALTLRGGGALEVRYMGKLATFMLYGAIPAFYVAEEQAAALLLPVAWGFGVVGTVLYYWVGIAYFRDMRAKWSSNRGD